MKNLQVSAGVPAMGICRTSGLIPGFSNTMLVNAIGVYQKPILHDKYTSLTVVTLSKDLSKKFEIFH